MIFTSPREQLTPEESLIKSEFNVFVNMNNIGENTPEKINN